MTQAEIQSRAKSTDLALVAEPGVLSTFADLANLFAKGWVLPAQAPTKNHAGKPGLLRVLSQALPCVLAGEPKNGRA